MSTANIEAYTREWWDKTAFEECWMTTLLFNLLAKRHQVTFKAGTKYKMTVETGTQEDQAQSYGDNDPLTAGVNSIAIKPEWSRKRVQVPVKILESEREEQSGGGDGLVMSYEERIVSNAQKSMRQKIATMLYGAGTDGGNDFQGVRSALTHDQTYGGISRATTATNELFQGASIGKTFADQATARSANIYNVRQCVDSVSRLNPAKPGDLVGVTSNENYRALQSQVDPSQATPPGSAAKYGFRSLFIDDVEVIADPWLSHNSDNATTSTYFFLLHLPDWKLLLSPKLRLGYMTPFFDQSQIADGTPFELARIKVGGNLICQAPNRSLFLSNMS